MEQVGSRGSSEAWTGESGDGPGMLLSERPVGEVFQGTVTSIEPTKRGLRVTATREVETTVVIPHDKAAEIPPAQRAAGRVIEWANLPIGSPQVRVNIRGPNPGTGPAVDEEVGPGSG